MRLNTDFFAVVPGSLSPDTGGQWFVYRFQIDVRNQTSQSLTLTPDTALRFGDATGHPSAAHLGQETVVGVGQVASLAFDRCRICGSLPPGEYPVTLELAGHDGMGNSFTQTLAEAGGSVEVSAAAQTPVTSIGAGMAYWQFIAAQSAQYARVPFYFRTSDIYPDDVTIEWQSPPEHFDVYLEDGTPLVERHVIRDVATSDWVALPLHYHPRPGLESDTVYRIGVLIARRSGVRCWHQGLGVGVGAGGTIRSILCADASLNLVCATAERYEIQPGQVFHLNACASNPKQYTILTDALAGRSVAETLLQIVWDGVKPDTELFVQHTSLGAVPRRPPASTALKVLQGDVDVSDKFTVEGITGANGINAGESAIVTLLVRAAEDLSPGWYRAFPIIGSFADTYGESGFYDSVPGSVSGEQTSPQVFDWIVVRPLRRARRAPARGW